METIEQKTSETGTHRKFPFGFGGSVEKRNEIRQMGEIILSSIREGRIDEINELCHQYHYEATEWERLIKEYKLGPFFNI